jgi:O-antigen/teichoic acid export membrane protein
LKSRSFIRDSLGIFNTNVFLLLVNIGIGVLIARNLGVYYTGVYYSLLVIPNFIIKIGTLGLGPSLIFHIGKGKYHITTIIKSVYKVFVVSSIIAVIGLFITFYFLNNPEYKILYVLLLIVYLPLQFIRLLNNRILIATKQIKKSNYLRIIPQGVNLLALVVFYSYGNIGILEAIVSLILSSIVINIIYYFSIYKAFQTKDFHAESVCMKSLLKYGILYALSSIVINFNFEFDLILMERLSSFNELGIYKMGVNFAQMLQQIPAAIFPLIMIKAAHSKDKMKNVQQSLSIFRLTIIISLLASAVLYLLAPILIPFFYGEEFYKSAIIVQTILPGIIFMVAFAVLSSQTAGAGKPLFVFYSFLPALIVNIILNILWIPEYGGIGAAWASNISYLSGSIIFSFFFIRYYNLSFFELFKFSINDIKSLRFKT